MSWKFESKLVQVIGFDLIMDLKVLWFGLITLNQDFKCGTLAHLVLMFFFNLYLLVFYFLLSAFYFFKFLFSSLFFFLYLTFDSFYKHLYPVNINFLSAVFNYKAINVKLAPKLNHNPQLFMKYQLISSHPNPPQNSINQNDDNLTLKLTFYQRTPLYPKFWVIILVCFICYYFGFNPKKFFCHRYTNLRNFFCHT